MVNEDSGASWTRLTRRLDRWISPEILAAGEPGLTRARILLLLAGAVAGASCWAAFYQTMWGAPALSVFGLAMLSAAVAVPFLLRRARSHMLPGGVLTGGLFLAVSMANFVTAGQGVASAIFLATLPLVGAMTQGVRAGFAWSALTLAEFALLQWMLAAGIEPWVRPSEAALATAHLRGPIFVSLIILVATVLYEALTDYSVRQNKLAHDELAKSEVRYRELLEASPDGLFVLVAGRVRYASRALLRLLGHADPDALVDMAIHFLVVGMPDRGGAGSVSDDASPERAECEIVGADGLSIPVELSSSPVSFDGRAGLIFQVRDLRPQRDANRDLAMIRAVVDQAQDGIVILDIDARVLWANEAAVALLDFTREELVGVSAFEAAPAGVARDALEELAAGVRRGEPVVLPRLEVPIEDAPSIFMDIRAFPLSLGPGEPQRWVAIVRDETRVVGLEEQIASAQRIDALGKLAGGIAHDFNNLLTVISGQMELVDRALPEPGPHRARIAVIRDACEKSAALTAKILAFGRKQMLLPELLDPNAVITELDPIVRQLVPERVGLTTELRPGLPFIRCDRAQIEQVLVDLVANARDAIDAEGHISIRTEVVSGIAVAHGAADGGEYVVVSVSDDGRGIEASALGKIFDPFFTTKGIGQGTGLGLATVHGIVHQSGGELEVESTVGVGTTIRVLLPGAAKDAIPPLSVDRSEQLETPAEPGAALLVEDHPQVRALVADALVQIGYEVISSEDGRAARRQLDARSEPFDALVTDMIMPGESGLDLVRVFTERFPEARAVIMSGYAEEETGRLSELPPRVRFLQKPFSIEELARALRGG